MIKIKKIFFDAEGRFDVVYIVYLIWCIIVLASTLLFYDFISNISELYAAKFQIAMFAGFLTLGSFLLTLKAFVVIQFKTQLFEKSPYRAVFKASVSKGNYRTGDYYQPLDLMARLLLLSVISALGTSLCQVTIGFIQYSIISAFCIALGIATLIIVCFAWWIVRKNTLQMIKYWEGEAMTPAPWDDPPPPK